MIPIFSNSILFRTRISPCTASAAKHVQYRMVLSMTGILNRELTLQTSNDLPPHTRTKTSLGDGGDWSAWGAHMQGWVRQPGGHWCSQMAQTPSRGVGVRIADGFTMPSVPPGTGGRHTSGQGQWTGKGRSGHRDVVHCPRLSVQDKTANDGLPTLMRSFRIRLSHPFYSQSSACFGKQAWASRIHSETFLKFLERRSFLDAIFRCHFQWQFASRALPSKLARQTTPKGGREGRNAEAKWPSAEALWPSASPFGGCSNGCPKYLAEVF